jgi:hypothetical protein
MPGLVQAEDPNALAANVPQRPLKDGGSCTQLKRNKYQTTFFVA